MKMGFPGFVDLTDPEVSHGRLRFLTDPFEILGDFGADFSDAQPELLTIVEQVIVYALFCLPLPCQAQESVLVFGSNRNSPEPGAK